MSQEHAPYPLREMPPNRAMSVVDELTVGAPVAAVFPLVADVAGWPVHLRHYRYVKFRHRTPDGGGLVEMSANRPFGVFNWPTWWLSEMRVDAARPAIRFRHVGGITTGMDVEWSFEPRGDSTHVRLLHVWDGPAWPVIRVFAARQVIGPVFIHGIASRTLAGLARAAQRSAGTARSAAFHHAEPMS